MRSVGSVISILIAAGACGRTGGGGATGSGGGSAIDCEAARAHVTALYRDEAAAAAPEVAPQRVADNTAMVIAECTREPGRVAACAARARSAAELEARCLAPLDDEGSEGDVFLAR